MFSRRPSLMAIIALAAASPLAGCSDDEGESASETRTATSPAITSPAKTQPEKTSTADQTAPESMKESSKAESPAPKSSPKKSKGGGAEAPRTLEPSPGSAEDEKEAQRKARGEGPGDRPPVLGDGEPDQ